MAMRVYELSKQLNISNKELLNILQQLGFEVSSHISVLTQEAIDKASEKVNAKKPSSSSKQPSFSSSQPKSKSYKSTKSSKEDLAQKPFDNKIIIEPMTVADFAFKAQKPVTEVILALLKKGIAAAKNNVISEKVVLDLVNLYNLEITSPQQEVSKDDQISSESSIQEDINEGNWKPRLPIVVVIGHVDHGKTTLLDFIRKSRVASKEKGGITQHLGAYEVETKHGGVVFLDTPGHEAFSIMRARGIKVADVAILIVAADDGVMPQTVEAIERAKEVGLPVIVAINKIDKASPAQIENVKKGLAQYDLLPEEWGGQTVCIPISAKQGTGVEELLEVVSLQAELMELRANLSIAPRGYVLESKIEKGLGPVATVICLHGKLNLKDYFIAGDSSGRINSMMNTEGKRVTFTLPSIPVQISGFSVLPQAGDGFQVTTKQEARKGVSSIRQSSAPLIQSAESKTINIIVKADNASSKEALVNSIQKISKKTQHSFVIVYAGVGNITEGDVHLAADTQALLYGFTVKTDPSALLLSQKLKITINNFDIIYKLLEDLEAVAESRKEIKYISKKVGEASVLKVFDIKNLGVIAGSIVKSGYINKDCLVKAFRGKQKIGEGKIKSLQRERKTVKEVNTGFEFGFIVEGITDWQMDDRVECFLQVPENE